MDTQLSLIHIWVLPDAGMTVQAAGGTEVEYTVSVTDEDGALADVSVSAQTCLLYTSSQDENEAR